ncbi:MAG: class I SAM-dependent methyltransferase [Pseudomonadota bacterium]
MTVPEDVSPWVARWAAGIPAAGAVLDLACGGGRHAVYLAGQGFRVTAVDRDMLLSAPHHGLAGVEWLEADLEAAPWPLAGRRFDGVLVSRYLHRPLFEHLLACLVPGGILIYETFSMGQARYGRPRNPAHLLMPGELLEWVRGHLRVLAYEDVEETAQRRCMQRLCARRP